MKVRWAMAVVAALALALLTLPADPWPSLDEIDPALITSTLDEVRRSRRTAGRCR